MHKIYSFNHPLCDEIKVECISKIDSSDTNFTEIKFRIYGNTQETNEVLLGYIKLLYLPFTSHLSQNLNVNTSHNFANCLDSKFYTELKTVSSALSHPNIIEYFGLNENMERSFFYIQDVFVPENLRQCKYASCFLPLLPSFIRDLLHDDNGLLTLISSPTDDFNCPRHQACEILRRFYAKCGYILCADDVGIQNV